MHSLSVKTDTAIGRFQAIARLPPADQTLLTNAWANDIVFLCPFKGLLPCKKKKRHTKSPLKIRRCKTDDLGDVRFVQQQHEETIKSQSDTRRGWHVSQIG